MSTRAQKFLDKHKISYEVVKYDHKIKGAEFASTATGFPLEQTIKTLVVELSGKGHVLVLMPGNREVSMKNLAKAFKAKKGKMADTATAQRLTGYLVGGISPFGVSGKMEAVMDESLQSFEQVMINGGQRGLLLKIDPQDIANVLDCKIAPIS